MTEGHSSDRYLDRITLTGVSATGYHGVLEHERREGQTFVADVSALLDTRRAAATDDLAHTLDYGRLAEQVVAVLRGEPADLVETVAERIAATVLAHPQVQAVEVTVHKPQAPIPVPFGDVTVQVHRDRSWLPAAEPVRAGTQPWQPGRDEGGVLAVDGGTDPTALPVDPTVVVPMVPALDDEGLEPAPPVRASGLSALPVDGPAAEQAAAAAAAAEGPVEAAAESPEPSEEFAQPDPATHAASETVPVVPVSSTPVEMVMSTPVDIVLPVPAAAPVPAPAPAVDPAPTGPDDPALLAVAAMSGQLAQVPAPASAEDGALAPSEPTEAARPAGDVLDAAPDAPVEVVIALGSNLGSAQDTLRAAVADLADTPGMELVDVSALARTAPVGGPEQPDFLNAVVIARTTLPPRDLLRATAAIEDAHGRRRDVHWGPRTLDIDIIAYGDVSAVTDDLELPHPRAHERAFVLQPWSQVRPDAELHGLGGGPVAVLAATAPDREGVRWLALDWLTAPVPAAQLDPGAHSGVPAAQPEAAAAEPTAAGQDERLDDRPESADPSRPDATAEARPAADPAQPPVGEDAASFPVPAAVVPEGPGGTGPDQPAPAAPQAPAGPAPDGADEGGQSTDGDHGTAPDTGSGHPVWPPIGGATPDGGDPGASRASGS